MKTLFVALVIALTSFVGVLRAEISGFPMGNPEVVTDYLLKSGRNIVISILQGNRYVGGYAKGNISFNTKEEMDSFFAMALNEAVNYVIHNNSGQNMNTPFQIKGQFSKMDVDVSKVIHYFDADGDFSFEKSSDGSYHSPDLSHVKLNFPINGIPYKIENLQWWRMIVTATDGEEVVDYHESDVVTAQKAFIFIRSPYALSGTNGATRIKISLVSDNKFQVFGPMGLPVPEELPVLKLVPYTGTISTLQIVGGEVGRIFKIQRTSDVSRSWDDIPDSTFTVRSGFHSLLIDMGSEEKSFFRLCAVDGVPQTLQKK